MLHGEDKGVLQSEEKVPLPQRCPRREPLWNRGRGTSFPPTPSFPRPLLSLSAVPGPHAADSEKSAGECERERAYFSWPAKEQPPLTPPLFYGGGGL